MMTQVKNKKLILKKVCTISCLVLVCTFFFSFSVEAYTTNDVVTKKYQSWGIDNFGLEYWETIWDTDYEVEKSYSDNAVLLSLNPESSGLVGPNEKINQTTLKASFYVGKLATEYFYLPYWLSVPQPASMRMYNVVNAYTVVDYSVSDGTTTEARKATINHSSYTNNPMSDGVNAPFGSNLPDIEGFEGGFLWDNLTYISVNFGRPVFLNMVTTYIEFEVNWALFNSEAYESGLPELQFSYRGNGLQYVSSDYDTVYKWGLQKANLSFSEALRNADTTLDGNIFEDADVYAVADLLKDLLEIRLVKSLVVIALSAGVVSAVIGVAVYSGSKKGGGD